MNIKYAFNGFLFTQTRTGVMRFAEELLQEIDKICMESEFQLVVPIYAKVVPRLERIKVVYYGATKGNFWEQIDFARYLGKHGLISVNFNNTMPILKPGIIAIHDIAYRLHPEFGSSFHGKISNIYHRMIFKRASRSNCPIITVSYFTKLQLVDFYKINPGRIHVVGNAWQHFERIGTDESILREYNLQGGDYYFSLGSLSKMKNTKWFIEVARNNPEDIFVLAGAKALNSGENFVMPPNVHAVGYITDEQIKSLIQNCKAFVYPSIYDGFGIPPLEALSQGAQVFCSYAACLPEIYRNCVHYIDPYDTDIDLEKMLHVPVDDSREVLKRYSWEKSAAQLYYGLLQGKEIE